MALGGFVYTPEGWPVAQSQKLSGGISSVFTKRRLDNEALEELEDLLISADIGTAAARRVIAGFRRSRFGSEVTDEEVGDNAGGGNR